MSGKSKAPIVIDLDAPPNRNAMRRAIQPLLSLLATFKRGSTIWWEMKTLTDDPDNPLPGRSYELRLGRWLRRQAARRGGSAPKRRAWAADFALELVAAHQNETVTELMARIPEEDSEIDIYQADPDDEGDRQNSGKGPRLYCHKGCGEKSDSISLQTFRTRYLPAAKEKFRESVHQAT
jgi:hypothetical protein